MENQDILPINTTNSLLPSLEQQQVGNLSSDPLQLSDTNLNQSGSFSDPMLTQAGDFEFSEVNFDQSFDEIFGNYPIIKANTNTSQLPTSDNFDPLIGDVSTLLAGVVWDSAVSTTKERLEAFTEDLAGDMYDSTVSKVGEQLKLLTTSNDTLTEDETSLPALVALELGVSRVKDRLETFAGREDFLEQMKQAFGDNVSSDGASAVIQDLASGEAIPDINIVSADELNNANGGFAQDTIYLSEEFLTENATNPEVVESVLLEEIGHFVDEEVGGSDSRGDEGDIFSRVVRGETISGDELGAIKAEDDSATINLNGEEIDVELADPPYPGYLFQYEEGENLSYDENVESWQKRMKELGYNLAVDGLYGPESESVTRQFQQDQGLAVDGIVGPNTWEASFETDSESRTSYTIQSGDTLTEIAQEELGDSSLWDEIEKEDGTTFTEQEARNIKVGQVVYLPGNGGDNNAGNDGDNNAVNIAKEQWEFFEQGQLKEYQNGGWQRVGEYWDSVGRDNLTGKDTDVPWSAAFISWVMKEVGAGDQFNYSASHSNYITDAIENKKQNDANAAFIGHKLNEYSPKPGDLVGRARQSGVGYNTPPTYKSHVDIVVETRPGEIDVIGGNVSNSVTLKTLPVDSQGRLINTDSRNDNDWFVVIENRL